MTHQDNDLCKRLRALERRIIDRRRLTGFDTEALPQAAAEIERLWAGIKKADEYMDINRIGDASFILKALLCVLEDRLREGSQ